MSGLVIGNPKAASMIALAIDELAAAAFLHARVVGRVQAALVWRNQLPTGNDSVAEAFSLFLNHRLHPLVKASSLLENCRLGKGGAALGGGVHAEQEEFVLRVCAFTDYRGAVVGKITETGLFRFPF